MTLATIPKENRPSTRPVLIKGYDERGIVWYTNYESRKGIELAGNPWAALQFHWVELERVVRIEGKVEKVSDKESDDYFKSRPFDHRIGAWASPQSQVIASRTVIEICGRISERSAPAQKLGWLPVETGVVGVLAGEKEPVA
jgi:pyridoxamine 5'-phosphate oxidase